MVTRRKTVKKTTGPTGRGTSSSTTTKRAAPRKKSAAAKPAPVVANSVLDLGDVLVIADVLEWHQKIIAVFESGGEISIDGGRIEQIDGAGLQLLVAVIKEAVAKKVKVVWKDVSDTLYNAAAQLGLSGILLLDESTEAG